jgi:hypothetical protein
MALYKLTIYISVTHDVTTMSSSCVNDEEKQSRLKQQEQEPSQISVLVVVILVVQLFFPDYIKIFYAIKSPND